MAKLAVFGDSILDKYSFFKSYRTSPEAPVPVINDEVNEYYLGGAGLVSDKLIDLGNDVSAMPGMMALVSEKLIDLGNEVDLYTMIGDSSYSKIFTSLIKDINVFDFAEKGYDVTTKERIIVNGNYFLRKDVDSKLAPNLSDVVAKFSESISTYDGAIFVDYDKGFLNQNLFNLLAGLTSENNITSILDPNINNIQNFHNLDFIKLM